MCATSLTKEPVTILLDLDGGDYYDVLDEVAALLKSERADAQVKGGALLEPRGQRAFVGVSSFHPERGRTLNREGYSGGRLLALRDYHECFDNAERIDSWERIRVDSLLGDYPECISISHVPRSLDDQLVDIARRSGMLLAVVRWNPARPEPGRLLWRQLILTRVVAEGNILMTYEEVPINDIVDERTMSWVPDRQPWEGSDGFFFDDDYVDAVYPELRFAHLSLPEGITVARSPQPLASPLQRVINRVGRETVLRLGSMDDPDIPGQFTLPTFEAQYPDLLATEKRIINYCLKRGHPEKKWVGFDHYGWGWHPQDSTRLAALFCSALLFDFHPHEVSVTADGAIHFSVNVVLPSPSRYYMPTTTAWISEPGGPLRMHTAFVVSTRGRSFDPAQVVPPMKVEECWDDVVQRSTDYGGQVAETTYGMAMPRLYLERAGQANALAKGLARAGLADGTFERAPLGRTLLVGIGDATMSWEKASRTAAFAQVQLGHLGVRSKVGTWVD